MIGKVVRGSDVGGLLRYLFGPGKANEHTDPHVVAVWDGDVSGHQSAVSATGRHDVRHLSGLLEQPVTATTRKPDKPVWHASVRTAPTDRRLTDAEWADIARDIVHRAGFAPDGDDAGCRWVAVRHADDHIHLVVTLARQDGRPARTSNDFYRLGEECRAAEQRLGLAATAGRDRTAARRPSRAESEKANRSGRREPARVVLQREVRGAVAGAATLDEFLTRLVDAGLLVRQRHAPSDPNQVTGYAVALPGDRTRDGAPVWFGGGKLAADLSWPKLAARWHASDATDQTASVTVPTTGRQSTKAAKARDTGPDSMADTVRRGRSRLTGQARVKAWHDAHAAAETAAGDIGRLAFSDPAAASDVAHATGRTLSATARAVEGRAGGPLTAAADAYDRAARDLHARTPPRTPAGDGLRSAARLIALTGRASKDETTQVLALVAALAALSDAVASLRDAQQRAHQAAAARTAATQLRALPPLQRRPPEPRRPENRPAVVHSPLIPAAVHSPPPKPPMPPAPRRKVQS